eukprot:TRINITY_DN4395_c0_g1_i1.p2 TRINITY_DN4395_c0_g1~~TRINITY_DN4395_c0_g1_i1.p2  ORF type:complete len:120 (+),score=36.04 TRINITY_DN4395_c0_g1_i1:562-921(+)
MDDIKSKCFVIFETEAEAEATRNALHNLVWPPHNHSKLQADFSTEEEAKRLVLGGATTTNNNDRKRPRQEKPKELTDIFKKTSAKPQIFWLPLTEEEIQKKNQPVNNGTEQKKEEKENK